MHSTFLIGVCGGSGSGKTTFAKMILDYIGAESCNILGQDSYYHDACDKFDHDGGSVNFDHPEAINFELMAEHIKSLKLGNRVDIPVYDFKTHKKTNESVSISPKPITLVDGTLILSQSVITELIDIGIFLDICEDLRLNRRIKRDVQTRGRKLHGVKKQYESQVKPMHDEFVGPSSGNAIYLFKSNEEGKDFIPALINRLKIEFNIKI